MGIGHTVVLTCGMTISTASGGGVIAVNRVDDAPAVDPLLGPDTDPGTPGDQITLRSAIQHINTLPLSGSYVIELLPATFYPLTVAGHGEQNAETGDLDIKRNLTIRAPDSTATVDADGLGDRVFDVVGPVALRLERVRTFNGTAVPGTSGVETGGGIRSIAGSLVELGSRSSVANCSATGDPDAHGGGIDAGGELRLVPGEDSGLSISLCHAEGDGGGIRVAGMLTLEGDVAIGGCNAAGDGGGVHINGPATLRGRSEDFPAEIFQNTASGAGGGLYLAPEAGPMDARHMFFRLCTADTGGAAALHARAAVADTLVETAHARNGASFWVSGDTTLERVLSRYGIASEHGGSSFVATGGSLQIVDASIEDNEARLSGGSIFVDTGATLRAVRSTIHDGFVTERGANILNLGSTRLEASRVISGRFTGDGAGEGAGVYNAGSLVAINTFIAVNGFNSQRGGALFNSGDAYLVHCNLLENTGNSGTLVENSGTVEMSHCVVRTSPEGAAVSGEPIDSLGWNLDVLGAAGLSGPGDLAGTPLEPADPSFAGFVFPFIESMPVVPLSPCLDAGNSSASVDDRGIPILTDFSGNPRAIGAPDIGITETCTTDFVQPFGVINFFDVSGFIHAWQQGQPTADFAEPLGSFDFFDIAAFLARFNDGC